MRGGRTDRSPLSQQGTSEFPGHPSQTGQISAGARAKSCFLSKVKNFLLRDPSRRDQSSSKVLQCHFYCEIFVTRRIGTFVWPFCFLVHGKAERVTPFHK